jgi:hypothetical protein
MFIFPQVSRVIVTWSADEISYDVLNFVALWLPKRSLHLWLPEMCFSGQNGGIKPTPHR